MTVHVQRKRKRSELFLEIVMIVLSVLFLLGAILANRGLMLPCFLTAGLYFLYDRNVRRSYEYHLDGSQFTIDVLHGLRRKTVHELELSQLEVLADHSASEVAQYRKGAKNGRIRKFDYTSYDDEVPYYTMIIAENGEKIKLLLDLSDEMLDLLHRKYPQKVFL